MGSGLCALGFSVRGLGSGLERVGSRGWKGRIGMLGFGVWVSGLGFRVSGLGFRVSGFGFRVSGFDFRVVGASSFGRRGW